MIQFLVYLSIFCSDFSKEKCLPKKRNGSNSLDSFETLPLAAFLTEAFSGESWNSPDLESTTSLGWGENIAQLLLKNKFAVNYFTFLYVPTVALWILMMSPILWEIGRSSNLLANNTKVQCWITPSGPIGREESAILMEHTNLSDLNDLWGNVASITTP